MMITQRHSMEQLSTVPFSAGEWLARYIELGGSYSMVGDAIWLHCLINADIDEMAIQAHERLLRGRPDRRDAVKTLIVEGVSREVVE